MMISLLIVFYLPIALACIRGSSRSRPSTATHEVTDSSASAPFVVLSHGCASVGVHISTMVIIAMILVHSRDVRACALRFVAIAIAALERPAVILGDILRSATRHVIRHNSESQLRIGRCAPDLRNRDRSSACQRLIGTRSPSRNRDPGSGIGIGIGIGIGVRRRDPDRDPDRDPGSESAVGIRDPDPGLFSGRPPPVARARARAPALNLALFATGFS